MRDLEVKFGVSASQILSLFFRRNFGVQGCDFKGRRREASIVCEREG